MKNINISSGISGTAKCYFILIISWIVSILLVNPIGNFPLNDDWSYAYPVKSFIETGKLIFTDWPAMTLIGQILYGILFSEIFGFSFTVLRLSVLFLGIIGIITTFHILQKSSPRKKFPCV